MTCVETPHVLTQSGCSCE